MSDLPRLSASKIKTFTACPRQYWYRYIKRDESRHIAAAMGSAVHTSIDRTYRAWKEDKPADPATFYTQGWYSELEKSGIPDDNKVYKEGLGIVQRYDWKRRTPEKGEVEFILPFPDRHSPMCEIHGYIDQIYDWGLVDLKTNKRKPDELVLNHDLQFIIYSWAYLQLYGEKPNHVFWYHLRTNEDIPVDAFSRAKVEYATRKIDALLEEQYQQANDDENMFTWFDKNIGPACMWCSYKRQCLGEE